MLRIGRRTAALLFYAFLQIVLAIWLFSLPPLHGLYIFHRYIWAAGWAASAIVCLLAAIMATFDAAAFGLVMSMMVGWSVANFHAEYVRPTVVGWLGGCIWLAFAGFTWIIAGWPDPDDNRRRRHPP